jgi:response regulator RpfG family c-di-GMP phosphodiesterase
MLKYIFDTFSNYIPYTHIGVALISDDKKRIKASYAMTNKHKSLLKKLVGYEMIINNTSLGKVIESGEERIINDLEEYVIGKPLKEYNKMLIEEGIKASITFPLRANDNVLGIIFFSSDTKNVYKKEHIRFLRLLANSMGLSLEKSILIDDLVISTTLSLAKLTEERDSDTGEHLSRMSYYSRMLAEVLSKEDKYKDKIDIDYIDSIERFSPLHDIGKVAIKDEILLKPGKLTYEEYEIMKTHAIYGGKVLRLAEENLNRKGRSIFRVAIEIAEGHHEKWDGSGYPYGKSKEEIPLSARIVALADVFDALTSKRPYKEPFSFERSVEMIVEGKGKHFDPEIVDAFLKNRDKFERSYNRFNDIEEVS